jgi:outer membrane protein TolC
MRGQRFPLILCALTLFCFHPLQAEDAAAPTQLSLTDAVGMTIDVNANLKSANQSRLSSLSRLKVASFRTTYNIGSNTELSHYHSTGSSLENSSVNSTDIKKMTQNDIDGLLLSTVTFSGFGGTEGTLNFSPYSIGNSYGTIGLTLRQPLMRGRGKLSEKANTFRGAEIDASIQDKQFYLTRQSTIQGVIESYYRAVVAREQVKVQERAVSIAEEAVQSARKRADAGLVAEIEVSRAEIRLAQTKDELNQQVQSARGALDRLMLAIGSGVGQTPELTDSVPEVTMELPTLVDAMKTALANRTELSVYDDRLTDQSRKMAFANDQLQPSFDVVANNNSTNDQKGIISKRLLSLDTLTAGVEFRFPIDKRTTMI